MVLSGLRKIVVARRALPLQVYAIIMIFK